MKELASAAEDLQREILQLESIESKGRGKHYLMGTTSSGLKQKEFTVMFYKIET